MLQGSWGPQKHIWKSHQKSHHCLEIDKIFLDLLWLFILKVRPSGRGTKNPEIFYVFFKNRKRRVHVVMVVLLPPNLNSQSVNLPLPHLFMRTYDCDLVVWQTFWKITNYPLEQGQPSISEKTHFTDL